MMEPIQPGPVWETPAMYLMLHSIITGIPAPFNMVVLIVLISCVAGVAGTLVKEVRKFACHRQELVWKRDLVERGLSVEEIERVVAAGKSAVR
jgi:hypothetical protein